MRAEILYIDDCPSWEEAARLLRGALDSIGHRDTAITYTRVESAAAAARVTFAGSPTILVDGSDLFPSDGRTNDLACRIYPTPVGLAGWPTQEQLQQALIARG